jgi:hypothetical protein
MESAELLEKKAVPESLTRLGFKIRRFGSLPEGFDPLTATNRQLADHGLPRRPDVQSEPELCARWERVMTETKTWIAPEFTELSFRTSSPDAVVSPDFINYVTSSFWSGATQLSGGGLAWTCVAAKWTVSDPNTANYHPVDDNLWLEATWVGIDGYYSPDVLQAGTSTEIRTISLNNDLEVDVWAWWEWYPASPHAISNFPVSPGDVVYCLIRADDTMTGATIYFSNLSTGLGTHFHITPPSGTTLAGDSVEWIVERPGYGSHRTLLPNYVERYLDECITGYISKYDGSQGLDNLANALWITMTNENNDVLSSPSIENDALLNVSWRKSS